jgi:endonuclease/exonuclease/phosphatase family metal-dependent hydrolase
MVANTALIIIAAIRRKRTGLFYLVPMLIGVPYMLSTIGAKSYFQRPDPSADTFTLLNYNVSGFNVKENVSGGKTVALSKMYKLLLDPTTDIQCYQEFMNLPWSKEGNIIKRLTELGRHFYFSMEPETDHMDYSRMGTLIVSKFPIIASGDVLADESGFNRVSYVDVVVKLDTVRIINVHLHSMGLGKYDPRTRSKFREMGAATRTILSKLKEGVFERSTQTMALARFVERSPYPVVCAGDFNDMPYAYSYRYLRKYMKNAFEESGKGFGFTYNGGTLRVLRIDNQFYQGNVRSIDLRTRYDIPYTDHFPVQGMYEFTADN